MFVFLPWFLEKRSNGVLLYFYGLCKNNFNGAKGNHKKLECYRCAPLLRESNSLWWWAGWNIEAVFVLRVDLFWHFLASRCVKVATSIGSRCGWTGPTASLWRSRHSEQLAFFFSLPEKKQELFDWQCALHLMDLKGCVVPTVFYIARETASLQRRAMFFRKKSVLSILGIVDYMHPNNNEFPFL